MPTQNTHAKLEHDSIPHPTDVLVGSRIRFRRNEMKMPQASLAKGIGVAFQQLQKYENATNRVSASRLFDIAEILKVPVGYFFEGRDLERLVQP